jgi:hypothetical protein
MDTEHATNVTSGRCFSKQGRVMEAEQVDWDKINDDLRLGNMDFEGVLGKPLLKCDEIYSTAMPMRFLGNYEENHMIDAESNEILPSAVMSCIEIGGSSDYGLGRTAASRPGLSRPQTDLASALNYILETARIYSTGFYRPVW